MDIRFYSSWLQSQFSEKVSTLLSAKSIGISQNQKEEIIKALTPSLPQRVWHFIWKCIQKRPFFYFVLATIGVITFPAHGAHANEVWQDFEATAYYSPLPNQKNYYRGSYAADIRLNGKGTHGADGTPVYAGMIAAPKNYNFGTYIYFDGLGLTRVHDRWGAIKVSANGDHHDRIDIWMGYGDAGLARTKKWGRKNIRGKIITNPDLYKFLNLNTIDFSIGEATKRKSSLPLNMFKALGFEPVDGDTAAMVLKFQLQFGVVDSEEAHGAGYFGPKTTAKLREVYDAKFEKETPKTGSLLDKQMTEKHKRYQEKQEKVFSFRTNSIGKKGSGIKALQEFLIRQWVLDARVNDGIMNIATLGALRKYQYQNGLIQTGRLDLRTKIKMIDDLK